MSIQTTISFPIRKKCNFYGHKKDVVKEDFSEATVKSTPTRYTPRVKKIITLISSESESESDIENTTKAITKETAKSKANNVAQTPTRRKRNTSNEELTTSPSKQRRDQLLQSSLTPSPLMDRLNLSSENRGNLQPKRLFESNQYQNARLALHSSETEDLPDIENTTKAITKETAKSKANNVAQTPTRRKRNTSNEELTTSPSKQRKDQLLQSSLTPSTLMGRLNLSCKKRENLQPKQLFESNQYQNARLALHSSETEDLPDIENTTKAITKETAESKANNVAQTPTRRKRNTSNEELTTSPSKQRKDQLLQSSLTPSTLMGRLNLSCEKRENLQPKQLFEFNQYQNARLALHSSETEDLPGRENELVKLQEFLQKHLEDETSGSLYISGPPGTGKTVSLSKIVQQPELKSQFKSVYINCTTMKSAAAIYAKIIQVLSINNSTRSGKNNKAIIEKYLTSKHKMLLLVLDEIDQLESKRQSVLYSIFEWPSLPNSKLILVGVANALDLTDRILPRLQARCELKPTLMHFASYTKQQISDIISTRLRRADASNIFTSSAIQLLAGKVAAISGDIRRALDISRRVIELAESEKIAGVLRPTNDNDTNIEDLKKQTEITNRPVDLKEVVMILNRVYGSTQNFNKDMFPIHQKLLLCSLLLILNKGKNKIVTAGRLYEVYKKVCKKRNICAVDFSEFLNMCSLIETRGTLKIVGKKQSRLSKVNLQWDQSELESALQDKDMMTEIINDTTCL